VTLPEATVDNLDRRINTVERLDWMMNTDFQKVFELLLSKALVEEIPRDQMPSALFCFSDMEFDRARTNNGEWATDLEIIREEYAEAGYDVPELVFWNLRYGRGSKPANYSEPGVNLLSGFSAGMMKSFLEYRLDSISPLSQLMAVLQRYDDGVVAFDHDRDLGWIAALEAVAKESCQVMKILGNGFNPDSA